MSGARWVAAALIPVLLVACGTPAADVGPSDQEAQQAQAADDAEAAGLPPIAPLMRADGWRDDLDPESWPYRYLEVAFDEPSAQQAWDETTPDRLAERGGDPDRPGRYGSLADVDLDRQAVVIWSALDRGACTGWLADVRTAEDGLVELREDEVGEGCEDGELHPYRMVLAVDRDRLPEPEQLPTAWVDGPANTLATPYPASAAMADASARAEELGSRPVLDDSGDLIVPVDRIVESVGEYDGPPTSLDELAGSADAAVVARAAERDQTEDGPAGPGALVTTRQRFEVLDTWWGEVGDDVTVSFVGGVAAEGGEVLLLEDDVFPQFRHTRDYLLFLREPSHEAGYVWVHGQGEGRYLIDDDAVVGAADLDLQSSNARQGSSTGDLGDAIVGRDLDELRQDLLDRRR